MTGSPGAQCGIFPWARTELESHTCGLHFTLTENHPDSTARARCEFIVGHDDAPALFASFGIQADPCHENVSWFAFDLPSRSDDGCADEVCDLRPHDGPGRTGIQDCVDSNAPVPFDRVADLNLFHDFTHARPPVFGCLAR